MPTKNPLQQGAGKRAIDNQTDRFRSRNDYEEYTIPQSPAEMRGEQQYILGTHNIVENLPMICLVVNRKTDTR
jgi:hypothetical protein